MKSVAIEAESDGWRECVATSEWCEEAIRAYERDQDGKRFKVTKYRQTPPAFDNEARPLPFMVRVETEGEDAVRAPLLGSGYEGLFN